LKDPESERLILNELQSIKQDIATQKEAINDFKNVKESLEVQIKELERTYIDELKHNAESSLKNEQQMIKSF
jgi:hypothetical protein